MMYKYCYDFVDRVMRQMINERDWPAAASLSIIGKMFCSKVDDGYPIEADKKYSWVFDSSKESSFDINVFDRDLLDALKDHMDIYREYKLNLLGYE